MARLITTLLFASLSFALLLGPAEAGWKKRGWYVEKPGANCVIRKVAVTLPDGQVVIRKVRVCR